MIDMVFTAAPWFLQETIDIGKCVCMFIYNNLLKGEEMKSLNPVHAREIRDV